ncbi:YfhO family protein [Mycoplasma sp. P36-A1]|uniref:YfhO family protein n=1 Tax=Mycoplasma sp. P36-A1 TaxID=3252900 RepID=UPI003C2B15F7
MKNFKNKYSSYLFFTIFLFCVIAIFGYLEYRGLIFGEARGDFLTQHVRFIDYYRETFYKTGNLFQPITMNYGTTQDYANLYYHGFLNPYLMLSLLVPSLSTLTVIKLMQISTLILTYLFSYLLFNRLGTKFCTNVDKIKWYSFIFAVITAFSGCVLWHFSQHFMFFYYFPFIFLSYYALCDLVDGKGIIKFIISVALIMYTNFFFALIIGFTQIVFILYYFNISNASIKLKTLLFKTLLSYVLGIMLGAIVFIPEAFAIITSNRSSQKRSSIPIILNNSKNLAFLIFDSPYSQGMGIITAFAFILGLLNFKKKYVLILLVPLIIIFLSGHFNYLLNIMQYTHRKVYMYAVPLVLILLFSMIIDNKIKYKNISLIITIVLACCYVFVPSLHTNRFSGLILIIPMILQAIIFLLLINKGDKLKYCIILFIPLLAISTTYVNSTRMSKKDFYKKVLTKKVDNYYDNNIKSDYYRTLNVTNMNAAINHYSPILYSSVLTKDYDIFYNEFVNLGRSTFSNRTQRERYYNNDIFRKLFSIKQVYYSNKTYDATPFIYGVTNNQVQSDKQLYDNKNNLDRILAITQDTFVDSNTNNNNYQFEGSKYLIKEGSLNIEKGKNQSFNLISTKGLKDGTLYFEMSTKNKVNSKQDFCFDNVCTGVRPVNFYNEPANDTVVIMANSNKFDNKNYVELISKPTWNLNDYNNYKLYFIPNNKVKLKNVINTTNNQEHFNEKYEFDLNMPSDGFIATSIIYDKDYIISVNDEVVDTRKINGHFIGASVKAGSNKIIITLKRNDFTLGLIISTIAAISIVALAIYQSYKKKVDTRNK